MEKAQDRLTWSLEELAKQLGISKRHTFGLHAEGQLPSPVRLGRRMLWVADEIRAWLAAGAPSREVWEAKKQAAMSAH